MGDHDRSLTDVLVWAGLVLAGLVLADLLTPGWEVLDHPLSTAVGVAVAAVIRALLLHRRRRSMARRLPSRANAGGHAP